MNADLLASCVTTMEIQRRVLCNNLVTSVEMLCSLQASSYLVEPSSAIGKSTTEAMRSGAVHGYRGMVRGVLRAIRNELDETPTVIATGGDTSLIAAGLPRHRLPPGAGGLPRVHAVRRRRARVAALR